MEVYLVGGAVRDRLLGLPARERDWVVVGASASELLDLGYQQVGKDFPVFLHPETGEEYALARTERKVGPGYHGFSFDTGESVSLEQDLSRRDLTINAMARADDGTLIDPFGGEADLAARSLRHVSDAFAEDPVRVARVARFAARFAPLGFTVAEETRSLIQTMTESGELANLRPERLWQELERALAEPAPQAFLATLRSCGALRIVLPEVDRLYGVPQPARWHPEVDTGVHLELALQQAAKLSAKAEVRFAVLTHDLGKGTTPRDLWPKHTGHEQRSVELINELLQRLPVPRRFAELARWVARYHGQVHRTGDLRAATVLKLLEAVDALRRPAGFEDFLSACEADARGRTGLEDNPYPQAERLRLALTAVAAVPTGEVPKGLTGEAFGQALRDLRLQALKRHGFR
ncbi:MAG: multifunctional CCA addition/repair protein [Gammaproteobacteria bacterium]